MKGQVLYTGVRSGAEPVSGGVNRLKLNGSLGWSSGRNWRASWTTVHYAGYRQSGAPGDPVYLGVANPTLITTSIGPQNGYAVASQTYHNVNLTYHFGAKHPRSYFRGLTVQLTLNNVLDTKPPSTPATIALRFSTAATATFACAIMSCA